MFDGDRLSEIVREYAAFGNHHTGTPVDVATTEWLTSLLRELGASVRHDPYSFDRFVAADWSLTVDGEAAPSLPVFYSGVGSFDTTDAPGCTNTSPRAGSSRSRRMAVKPVIRVWAG